MGFSPSLEAVLICISRREQYRRIIMNANQYKIALIFLSISLSSHDILVHASSQDGFMSEGRSVLTAMGSLPKLDTSCDVIFLPNDKGQFLIQNLNEVHAPYMEVQELTKSILPPLTCSVIVLETDNVERLNQTLGVIFNSRIKLDLVLITNSSELGHNLISNWPKRTFDAYIFEKRGNMFYLVKKFLVADNPLWKTVRVTYRPYRYYILRNPEGSYHGPDYNVLKEVASRAKITFNFQVGRNFGAMIREVGSGAADMAISQAAYTEERYETAGDISAPFSVVNFYILNRIPDNINPIWTLIYPFDFVTWFLLAIFTGAFGISLALANLIPFDKTMKIIKGFEIFTVSFGLLVFEAAPQHLYSKKLFSKYLTALFCVWIPSALFLSLSYKSTLLASLVSVEQEEALDTWRELIDNKITIHMYKGLIYADLMQFHPRAVVRDAYWECLIGLNGIYTGRPTPEMKKLELDGKAVTIGTKGYAVGSLTGKRHLFMAGEELSNAVIGIHFVRRFPWKQHVDDVVGHMIAAGLIVKDTKDIAFIEEKPERDHERNKDINREKKLTLTHYNFTWIFLSASLVLGMITFLAEIVWARFFL